MTEFDRSPSGDDWNEEGALTGRASLDHHLALFFTRVFEQGDSPQEVAQDVIEAAPPSLQPALRRELSDLFDLAHTTVAGSRLEAGSRLGGHELIRVLGSGATGTVWEARSDAGERNALKIIHPMVLGSPIGQERIQQEIRQASQVRHRGLLPILEVIEGDALALVSPVIGDGETLADRIREARDGRPNRSARQTLGDLVQAIEGVAALHAADRAHLDLKPANLLLDVDGQCVVADLGLSKALGGETVTHSLQLVGTPAYMSPELARGDRKHAGARADVWALGVILQEAVSLERPFQAGSTGALLRSIEADPPAPLRSADPSLGAMDVRRLRSIVTRCLQKDPIGRYVDAEHLLRDLRSLLAGEPVEGSGLGQSLSLTYERHRRAAQVTLLAVGVAVLSTWGFTWVRKQEQRRLELFEAITEVFGALDGRGVLRVRGSLSGDALDRSLNHLASISAARPGSRASEDDPNLNLLVALGRALFEAAAEGRVRSSSAIKAAELVLQRLPEDDVRQQGMTAMMAGTELARIRDLDNARAFLDRAVSLFEDAARALEADTSSRMEVAPTRAYRVWARALAHRLAWFDLDSGPEADVAMLAPGLLVELDQAIEGLRVQDKIDGAEDDPWVVRLEIERAWWSSLLAAPESRIEGSWPFLVERLGARLEPTPSPGNGTATRPTHPWILDALRDGALLGLATRQRDPSGSTKGAQWTSELRAMSGEFSRRTQEELGHEHLWSRFARDLELAFGD